ncbi:hypothetical protein CLAIMM_06174 [Cladophialophora immunda]|nr:hypothetical protein CLAIMM_06174 [Cladophialophora immunda]
MAGWIPLVLTYYLLCPLIVFNMGLIGSIAALTVISKHHHGFVDVQDSSTASLSSLQDFTDLKHWAEHLYWTTLPTFVVAIFAAWFVATIAAVCERQPYVELAKEGGASGSRSILLDYHSMLLPLLGAVKNQHLTLGIFLFGSILANLSLTSLTSSLFSVGTSIRTSQEDMLIGAAFNDTGVDSRSNLKAAFDIVSAALVYNASFPPWTSADYAFPNFTLANFSPQGYASATNITTNLTAYSAEASCVVAQIQGGVSDSGDFAFTTVDRGCNVTGSVPLAVGASIYYQSFAVLDCPLTAGWSRMVLFTAITQDGDASLVSDVNVISCIPTYHQTAGNLSVSIGPTSSVWNSSFAPNSSSDFTFQPTAWQVYENGLHLSDYFDPTATVSASLFALLTVSYSQLLSGTTELQTSALVQASEQVFRSTFAATSHLFFLQPLAEPVSRTGALSMSTRRLFVVSPIAWIMVGVLVFLCIISFSALFYTHSNDSILTEEPCGIISFAKIVSGGACEDFARGYLANAVNNNETFEEFVHAQNIKGRMFRGVANGTVVIREIGPNGQVMMPPQNQDPPGHAAANAPGNIQGNAAGNA